MKPFLLTLSLLILISPSLFGESKFKWSFSYIVDNEKFGYIEVSPSFNWKKLNSYSSTTTEYWLPSLESNWECSVVISQINQFSYIKEEMTLTCHYGGKNKIPIVISKLECIHNIEKNILVYSNEDTKPIISNYKETVIGILGDDGFDDMNWVHSKCYGK